MAEKDSTHTDHEMKYRTAGGDSFYTRHPLLAAFLVVVGAGCGSMALIYLLSVIL